MPCKCALDGNGTGFCASVLGTLEYEKALSKKKSMYEKSSCHTLDRYNMEAQKQYFIENKYTTELKEAIEESFKVDNWPYVQDGSDKLIFTDD